jgi:hypothetical protein
MVAFVYGHGMQFRAIDVLIYPSDLGMQFRLRCADISERSGLTLSLVYLLIVAFVYGHGMQFRAIDVLIYPSDLGSVYLLLVAFVYRHGIKFRAIDVLIYPSDLVLSVYRLYNYVCSLISKFISIM